VRIRRLIGILGIGLASSSCSLEVPDDGVSIALYISVDRGTINPGEVVNVSVRAVNVGNEAFSLAGPSDCLLYVDVYDHTDARIYNSATLCTGNQVTQEIPAGAELVRSFVWDGSGSAGSPVPPGLYRIRPVAQLAGRPGHPGPSATVAVDGG
jgi:hypothetical protein